MIKQIIKENEVTILDLYLKKKLKKGVISNKLNFDLGLNLKDAELDVLTEKIVDFIDNYELTESPVLSHEEIPEDPIKAPPEPQGATGCAGNTGTIGYPSQIDMTERPTIPIISPYITYNEPDPEPYIDTISTGARKAFLDIETLPLTTAVFGFKVKGYIPTDALLNSTNLLSWAVTFDDDTTIGDVLTPEEIKRDNIFERRDDSRICHSLNEVMCNVDLISGHNIDEFDIKVINYHFKKNGIPIPYNFTTVDTLKVSKKIMKAPSHKLNELNKDFGLSLKFDTDLDLWIQCLAGNPEKLDEMYTYNRHDTVTQKQLYYHFLPDIDNHPNMALYYNDTIMRCCNCASPDLTRVADRIIKKNVLAAYHCNNPQCGHINLANTSELSIAKRRSLFRK